MGDKRAKAPPRRESPAMTPARFLDRSTPPHVVTLVLATGIGALSLNIFLPSLPAMARHFHVDYAVMQLSVSAYLAMSGLMQFFVGPISDRFGRRVVLLSVMAVFVVSTIGTLLAPNATVFLVCRMLQSAVAACFVLARAIVRDMVPADRAASMIGYVTMGMSLVPMIGPVIGGALDEAFGWQASFALLLLAGLAVAALIWVDLGETVARGGTGFRTQLRQYPQLLASVGFWGYCLSGSTAAGLFYAYLGGAPFVGAHVFRLSPVEVGYFFAIPAVGYGIGNFLSGRYTVRVGLNAMVMAGTVLATAALVVALAFDLSGINHPLIFFGCVGITGIGNGLALPSANAGMMSVRPELAGTASGLGSTIMVAVGAGLATLSGALLGPESGATPLIVLMLLSSALSVAAILWVEARARRHRDLHD
jgi:DHA1 family bicyclomycin/chloramphenicol resistance-like MFS transporter